MPELDFTNAPGNRPTFLIKDSRKRDLWRFYKNGTLVNRVNYLGQMISNAGCKYKYLALGLWDVVADSDALSYPVLNLPYGITIEGAWLAVDTTVANNTTNYQTIALKDADGNTIASITTASTGFTAGTPRTMGTPDTTHKVLTANEGVKLTFTKAAAGMAFSGMVLMLYFSVNNQYANPHSIVETEPPLMAFIDTPDADEVILSDREAGDHIDFNDGAFEVTIDGKVHTTSVDKYHVLTTNVGDITASGPTPGTFALIKPSAKIRIHKIYLGADTTLAVASDANFLTAKFNKFDGSNSFEICRANIGGPYAQGVDLTAGVLTEVADIDDGDVVERYADLTSSDTLHMVLTKTGTGGTDVSNLTVQVLYEKLE